MQAEDATMAGNTTARAVVEAAFRHRGIFWGTFWAVMALTAVIALLTPRTYESEMEILVRNARPDYLITPERSTGQIMQTEVTEERVGSEMDVLKSRDIADVVVDPGWDAKPLSARSDSEIKSHDKSVAEFDKHLTIEALKKSNVIQVSYVTKDARQAQAALDRLLTAFSRQAAGDGAGDRDVQFFHVGGGSLQERTGPGAARIIRVPATERPGIVAVA
jgi:uncharacterized protein involved in exopolysaccharide biosynthesis